MRCIGENNLCKFYTDYNCESLTNYCTSYFNGHPPLDRHSVYVCESKENGTKRYVLFNEKGIPVSESVSLDGMAVNIERMRFVRSET